MDKNDTRFGKDGGYTQYVNDTYDSMIEEGYDPESESVYAELDSRVGNKREAPKAEAKAEAPAQKPNKKRPDRKSVV